MGRRKSPLVSAFFKMTRAGMRQSTRIGQAAAKQGMKSGGELAEQAGHVLGGGGRVRRAPWARAGVGGAGVEDDGLQLAVRDGLLSPDDADRARGLTVTETGIVVAGKGVRIE